MSKVEFDNAEAFKSDVYWVDMQPPFQRNGDTLQVIDVRWKTGGVIHADTITFSLKRCGHNMRAFLSAGRVTYSTIQSIIESNQNKRRVNPMELTGLSKIETIAFRAVLKEQGKTSDEVIRQAVIDYIEKHFDALTEHE